ncbi:3-mercaptopyruvate sulfurtransferase [Misgurnus anguillicaudatus]|uniref:3-mercaptopyruvate sulfurtransferase n=1 Tax=Misgurnus anguillicaudatus TaxID=75329 RepID=UPI0024351CFE|nr:3-mercaptopyruvate sulfurtransferase [Misgurnus anguillicaudatus]
MAAQTRALVAARWLADAVKSNRVGPKLRILDASWYLPKLKRDAKAEFKQSHIPGASFFDIDDCCDKSSKFDHMLPSEGEFADYVGNLGIGNDTHVVVYDASDIGSFAAPRIWWMFRVFGHKSVSVLDGGFKNWLREGHPVTDQYTKPQRTKFKTTFNGSWVKTYENVLDNIKNKEFQVVDARANGRFRGVEPEPRETIEPGHIPGSINMPFTSFMDSNGQELPVEELAKLFQQAGVDIQKPFCVTCGSGVTACHIALAAHLCGHPGVYLYDGSWVEWFSKAAPEHVISEGKGKH